MVYLRGLPVLVCLQQNELLRMLGHVILVRCFARRCRGAGRQAKAYLFQVPVKDGVVPAKHWLTKDEALRQRSARTGLFVDDRLASSRLSFVKRVQQQITTTRL